MDLQNEYQRMWNEKVEVVQVIVGTTGVIENLKKRLSRISGQQNIHNLQRSAILGTADIVRKVLSIRLDQTADISQPCEVVGVGNTTDEAKVTEKTYYLRSSVSSSDSNK